MLEITTDVVVSIPQTAPTDHHRIGHASEAMNRVDLHDQADSLNTPTAPELFHLGGGMLHAS